VRTFAKSVAGIAAASLLIPLLVGSPALAAESSPVLLGENTAAAAKALPLNDLVVAGGQAYSSYGDFDKNVGPIALTSLNTTTGAQTTHLTVNGEELKALRRFGDRVFTADIDPRTSWTANAGFASNSAGSWQYTAGTPFIHVFDVARTSKEIFLAGSIVNPDPAKYGPAPYLAAIKKSADGGRTWTIEKARSSASGANDGDRYYWLAAVGDKVAAIAEVRDAKGVPNRQLDVYSGGRWSTVDLGTRSAYAMVHDATDVEVIGTRIVFSRFNQLVYIDLAAKGKASGVVISSWPADIGIADLTVANGVIYAVGQRIAGTGIDHSRNLVYASRDANTWQLVASPQVVPATTYWDHGGGLMIPVYGKYTAISVDGGRMYLGGNDARVYTVAAPVVR